MSQDNETQSGPQFGQFDPQPSLVGPVLLTAFTAAAMFSLPALMGKDSTTCCMENCCASFLAATLGFMPVVIYSRAGGNATPGVGCLIGLFGVGIGGIVGAIVQAQFPAYDVSTLREELSLLYDEMVRALEQQGQSFEMTREEYVEQGVQFAPYFVIVTVAFSSFLAGLIGLLAAVTFARRRPPTLPLQQPPLQPPPQ